MPAHIDKIKSQLSAISANSTLLDMLLEFERTLDNCDLYTYKNWLSGELVEGPIVDRYWFTCTFMYPYSLMPDPMGAVRLEKFGCKVSYEKDILEVPIKIKGSQSYGTPRNKSAKMKKHKVWLVKIVMPSRFIDEKISDKLEKGENVNIDTSDISTAYDDNIEDIVDPETGGE